jgi:hypothetical protein
MIPVKFKDEVKKLSKEIGCFSDYLVLNETNNTIKIKFVITTDCFVQVYVNFKKDLKNYVLVLNDQRIFGRDCDGGQWHKHPWENPSKHVFEKEMSLREFLYEVNKGLREKGIL